MYISLEIYLFKFYSCIPSEASTGHNRDANFHIDCFNGYGTRCILMYYCSTVPLLTRALNCKGINNETTLISATLI